MNSKRMIILFCALLVFFGTATWTDLVPAAANWAVLVATCGGFAGGYFFRKDYDDAIIIEKDNEIADLTDKNSMLDNRISTLEEMVTALSEKQTIQKVKKAKKVKEEPKGE